MSPNAKLAAFQSRIAKKITAISYKDVTFPASSFSPLSAFLKSSAAKTATSNTYRVNVCPDFTPSLMYLINESSLHRTDFESVAHPKASAMTYLAYQLNLIYCWFILHDLYVSPESVPYADALIDHPHVSEFLENVLDYPVPPQVVTVLSQWATSCLELQTHIWFCPSFADHTLQTHFGRIFPVTLFLNAHDLIATASANDRNHDLHPEYSEMPVFTVKNLTQSIFDTPTTTSRTFTAAHYFALNYRTSDTSPAPAYLANKINQLIVSYIGFDRIKGQKTKSRFSAANIRPVTTDSDRLPNIDTPLTTGFNPYLVYTALTSANAAELKSVYDAVSSVIKEKKLANTNLAKCFSDVPSSGIQNHGYSSFPLPHWDANPKAIITDTDPVPAPVAPTKMSRTNLFVTEFQSAIQFKITSFPASSLTHSDNVPIAAILTQTIGNNAHRAAIDTSTAVISSVPAPSIQNFFPLVNTSQQHDTHQDVLNQQHTDFDNFAVAAPTTADPTTLANNPTGTFVEFNEASDTYPKVKVIMPQAPSEESASMTTLRGLIIYSDELRASIVSHLSSMDQIDDDNSQFLQSAIQFSSTHLALHFETTTPHPVRVLAPAIRAANVQDATTMIRSATRVYAPFLAFRTFHFGFNSYNYGLTRPATAMTMPIFAQTFLGQTVATRPSNTRRAQTHAPDNTPTSLVLLWSPYTFHSPSADLDHDSSLADILKSTYFLSNLRTIFGSHLATYECFSPIYAMPTNA